MLPSHPSRPRLFIPAGPCRRGLRDNRQRRGLLQAAGALLLVSMSACAAGPAATDDAADGPARRAAVQALIDPPVCTADADCRTVAIGSKACGGPEAYLAWSTQRTDAKALESAVMAYGATRLESVAGGGRVSNCQVVTDPGAACLPTASGRACQLRPPRAAGSGPTQ